MSLYHQTEERLGLFPKRVGPGAPLLVYVRNNSGVVRRDKNGRTLWDLEASKGLEYRPHLQDVDMETLFWWRPKGLEDLILPKGAPSLVVGACEDLDRKLGKRDRNPYGWILV